MSLAVQIREHGNILSHCVCDPSAGCGDIGFGPGILPISDTVHKRPTVGLDCPIRNS